ncbi:hypothetical protein HC024_13960 [Methylococcaceae bacterium WWC4]|nr:hypothetical protein [Methylococcaceae bacterium WWC4]
MSDDIVVKLRDEIIESQKARSEFIKWKLLLIAMIGSIGYGLEKEHEQVSLVLALIPFVCIYVDHVCLHNDARIMVIGDFLRSQDFNSHNSNIARAYELHCADRRNDFIDEGFVLYQCSIFVSIVVLITALIKYKPNKCLDMDLLTPIALLISAAIGIYYSYKLLCKFKDVQKIA